MTEKELIAKIKELKQIKPNQNWVFLTKTEILGKRSAEPREVSIVSILRGLILRPVLKPVYIGVLTLFIIFGIFGFAKNSVPGDYLYPIKKAAEKSQTFFASDQERAQLSLEIINKRLEELTKIVEENQTKKLAPAIDEFQKSVSGAVLGSDPQAVRKVVEVGKKVRELQSRGVVIQESELQKLEMASLINVLEEWIGELENRSLTPNQDLLLDRMKEMVQEGKYYEALELYLRNQ